MEIEHSWTCDLLLDYQDHIKPLYDFAEKHGIDSLDISMEIAAKLEKNHLTKNTCIMDHMNWISLDLDTDCIKTANYRLKEYKLFMVKIWSEYEVTK